MMYVVCTVLCSITRCLKSSKKTICIEHEIFNSDSQMYLRFSIRFTLKLFQFGIPRFFTGSIGVDI